MARVSILVVVLALPALVAAPAPVSAQGSLTVTNSRGLPVGDVDVFQFENCGASGCQRVYTSARDGRTTWPPGTEAGDRIRWDACADRVGEVTVPYAPHGTGGVAMTIPALLLESYEPWLTDDERWLIGKVNQERARLGRAPLHISTTLSDAADRFSLWLTNHNNQVLEHQALCSPGERANDSGWPFGFGRVAENLARYPSGATGAFEGWMGSPGHYHNMTSTQRALVGLGRYRNVWTMLLTPETCLPSDSYYARCGITADIGDATLPPPGPPPGAGSSAGGGAGEAGEFRLRLAKRPKRRSRDRTPTFAFSAGADATFTCRIDRASWKACTSPRTYRVRPGRHRFSVRAWSKVGDQTLTEKARVAFRVIR